MNETIIFLFRVSTVMYYVVVNAGFAYLALWLIKEIIKKWRE